ncbi:MAG: heavy-metal-associated domain-containing protein [candidate division Zixibacteria bacterium]|nr:heavy-metal-associated domain-containing protein [candidate division Zixibacteria bacterium]
MKKATMFILASLAVMALAISPVLAGEGCGAKAAAGEAKAQMTSGKGCTTAHGEMSAAECAAKCASMSAEDLAKHCNYDGKVQMIQMSVKGMTCGGCENSIKASLEKIEGVVKVCAVSYKSDFAAVVVDPSKVKSEMLTTAISNKGYAVEVIPAVATMTSGSADAHKSCTPEQKAACASKKAACAAHQEAKTEETTSSDKQPH